VPPQGNSHSQKNGLDIPTLQNILGLAPPGSKIKHYKGEDGYGNYGHICIKNSWVDPESEEEVITALRRESTKSIPAPVIPIVSEGAKIMTLQEQDAFYKDYTREVSDLGDSEGDPRCLRIAPATFARWADGALKGDSYINTEVPSPVSLVYFLKPCITFLSFLIPQRLTNNRSHCLVSNAQAVLLFHGISVRLGLSPSTIWKQVL